MKTNNLFPSCQHSLPQLSSFDKMIQLNFAGLEYTSRDAERQGATQAYFHMSVQFFQQGWVSIQSDEGFT